MADRAGSSTFYRIRVTVLLVVLAGVVLYAVRDVHRRRERSEWDRTLDVAVVILREGEVDPAAIEALKQRVRELDARLAEELWRYRPGTKMHPFAFTGFGPIAVNAPPPVPSGDSWTELASYTYARWRYLSPIDDAADVPTSAYDARIYVVVRPPAEERTRMVEGFSEEGGRVGTVEVELDGSMVDFALFVVAHELLHTLGATDKYDAAGHVVVPDGLAEPDKVPRYPQSFVEVMARDRPLSPTEEVVPDSLSEMRIGPLTAREIGWSKERGTDRQ